MSKLSKKSFNMAYGIGASVVIIGALFKLLHWKFANEMLIIGMTVEALIFFLSAFEPAEEDLDWTRVYPELAVEGQGGQLKEPDSDEAERMLSQKLDSLLKDAKLDAKLIGSLGDSIKNFEGAATGLTAVSETVVSTNKYNDQMALATMKMESLNSLYQVQVEYASKQKDLDISLVENSQKLQTQMEFLEKNLVSLNGVYGGMLSAMSSK